MNSKETNWIHLKPKVSEMLLGTQHYILYTAVSTFRGDYLKIKATEFKKMAERSTQIRYQEEYQAWGTDTSSFTSGSEVV